MHNLLRALQPGSVILDLGCDEGSFDLPHAGVLLVRVDLQFPGAMAGARVQANSASLPFQSRCFDLIVSNHSLEHFEDLAESLQEIARVIKQDGALYIAVPDASTVTDKIYRWLARGGGHVNPFRSARELATLVEGATGLKLVAMRTLCTSLAFLNRKNQRTRAPRRLLLLGGGTEFSLLALNYFFRIADRAFRTRLSVYGWALYFGSIDFEIDRETRTNVCVRCGSGHSSEWLRGRGAIHRWLLLQTYRCPDCGARNVFTEDRNYEHLLPG